MEADVLEENEELLKKQGNETQTSFPHFDWIKAKGVTAIFIVVLLITISATSVQLLERRIPDLELNTFRSGIPLVCYIIALAILKKWPRVERCEIGTILGYATVTSFLALGQFIAVTFLPAATVFCVAITGTIISGLVLFALCWDEGVRLSKVLFACLALTGVILVIQPWMDWTDPSNEVDLVYLNTTTSEDMLMLDEDYSDTSSSEELLYKEYEQQYSDSNDDTMGLRRELDDSYSLVSQAIGYACADTEWHLPVATSPRGQATPLHPATTPWRSYYGDSPL